MAQNSFQPGSSQAQNSRASSYLLETADGFSVRVPADRVESWQKADHNAPLTRAEQLLKERILDELYGSKK